MSTVTRVGIRVYLASKNKTFGNTGKTQCLSVRQSLNVFNNSIAEEVVLVRSVDT